MAPQNFRGLKGTLRDSGAANPVVDDHSDPHPSNQRRLRVLALRPLTPLADQLPANNRALEPDIATLVHTEATNVRPAGTGQTPAPPN